MADQKGSDVKEKDIKENKKSVLHEKEGMIADEEIRIARKKISGGLEGDELDDNEEENTYQKGFDKGSS